MIQILENKNCSRKISEVTTLKFLIKNFCFKRWRGPICPIMRNLKGQLEKKAVNMSQAHKTQQKGHGAAQVQKIIKNTNQTGTIQNDKSPKNRIL